MIDIGVGTTIVLVFSVIVFILLSFRFISKLMIKKESEVEMATAMAFQKSIKKNSSDEEIGAAISMAIYLHTIQLHDQENPVITMIRVSRTYSPWSSKIYGLRKSPR